METYPRGGLHGGIQRGVSEEGGVGAWLRVWGRASQSDSWSLLLHLGHDDDLDVRVFHYTSTAVALSHQYPTGAFYRFEVYPASTLHDATFHAGVGLFGFFIEKELPGSPRSDAYRNGSRAFPKS
jgi:hypothetical protein